MMAHRRGLPSATLVPPWGLAVAAMLSVQLGSALSVPLMEHIGAAGTAWLRLTMGALVFLAVARPPIRSVHRQDLPVLLALGIVTGLMTMLFLSAIERIPLGTAVAVEFLGPLTVAAARSHSRRALVWPALALTGVVLLTEPWRPDLDLLGVGCAAASAVCWASYILLTQRVGDRFSGITGLSFTIPIAAMVAAGFGVPQAVGQLTPAVLAAGLGLALLLPVLPFAFELLALRRLTPAAFGTLMALEPAIGSMLGLVVLHQAPSLLQAVGVALVVLAGAAAQRGGRRQPPPTARVPARNVVIRRS